MTESPLPDPEGPPGLSEQTQKAIAKALGTGFVIVAGGVAAFFVLGTLSVSTSGAPRSQRINWEQRRADIAQAQAAAAAPSQDAATHRPGVPAHD